MNTFRNIHPEDIPDEYSAWELLQHAYVILGEKHSFKEYTWVDPEKESYEQWYQMAHITIADDSDHHRSRTGYMSYDSARIITLNDQNWLLALGEKTGDYPGSQYKGDIFALPAKGLEDLSEEDLPDIIKGGISGRLNNPLLNLFGRMPFFNSLIIAMSKGYVNFPKDGLGGKLAELTLDKFQSEYIAKELVEDSNYILASTLEHPTKQGTKYKPEAVDLLVDGIETVLSEIEHK